MMKLIADTKNIKEAEEIFFQINDMIRISFGSSLEAQHIRNLKQCANNICLKYGVKAVKETFKDLAQDVLELATSYESRFKDEIIWR